MPRVSDLFPQLRGRPGHGPLDTAAQRDEFLQASVDAGKIHASTRAAWRRQLVKSPQATAEKIERLEAGPRQPPSTPPTSHAGRVDAALAMLGLPRAAR